MRLDRALSSLGYGSRKDAQRLIRAGRVLVAGAIATSPALSVDPREVTLDGDALDAPDGLLVALHKPAGYVCSHSDRDGPSIYALVPPRWLDRHPKPTTVGRLDADSSGLILITDQMALVHELTSPRRHVEKRYVVELDRDVTDAALIIERFAGGSIVLDGRPCRPAAVTLVPPRRAEVVLVEGRHRQVRRMFSACGYQVIELHRTQVGPYSLDDLAPGEWRMIAR